MGRYAIGVDFGTLSARALVAEIGTGRELASSAMDYPHGVMDQQLPCGTKLPPDWALQHPQDYLDCLAHVVPDALAKSGVGVDEVIGIGIDFTACTLVPLGKDGAPLCFRDALRGNPHAYVKLWKHHAAQDEANRINEIAAKRGEPFLARYGGKISSEWMFPKIWQMLNEAPELYEQVDRFIEAGDWLVMYLTGIETRSSCLAGYKAMWHKAEGYPPSDFLEALDPRLRHVVDEKLSRNVLPIGSRAGGLTGRAATALGLLPDTAVAVCNVDAHVSIPATGLAGAGEMLMIMGTSTCHMMASGEEREVPGICGVVEDGMVPGLLGYEAGQCCMGDHFKWFVDNCVPGSYEREAADRGISIHELLTEKAGRLRPGQSGLVALDWWNGNRSVLVDADLTGMIVGMTLGTKPEEIYRALLEATAYGARVIYDAFDASGVRVERLYASGGISHKNPLVMQIYADVLGREIGIVRSEQASALGSAMYAAVAAGAARGGYDSIADAAREMGGIRDTVYRPIPENEAVYSALYAEYKRLHDYFGRSGDDIMKRLKRIRQAQV